MRKLFVALLTATVLLAGCNFEEEKPEGSQRYEGRYLYIRDAWGRCFAIDLDISVSGSNSFQSGKLKAFEVPATNRCARVDEGAK
jgi:hypothetical protein